MTVNELTAGRWTLLDPLALELAYYREPTVQLYLPEAKHRL